MQMEDERIEVLENLLGQLRIHAAATRDTHATRLIDAVLDVTCIKCGKSLDDCLCDRQDNSNKEF